MKRDNVILFPGSLERLLDEGLDAVEDGDYERAIKAFEQVYRFDTDHQSYLAPYAVALYETKDFVKAKEIAEKLLQSGTANYIDAMELYLAISIQLQLYDEVEMAIDALFEEDAIPEEMVNKFNYLRQLNQRLSDRYTPDETRFHQETFTLEEFLEQPVEMQQNMLSTLESGDITSAIPVIAQIVEQEELRPLVVTFALVLLYQVEYEQPVTVKKFGREKTVIPSKIALPNQDERTAEVLDLLGVQFEKDPSMLQLAIEAVQKYGILDYPFSWDGHSTEEVAKAYAQYIHSMFSGNQIECNDLCTFIRHIDQETDR